VPLTHKQGGSLTAIQRPSSVPTTKVSEIDGLANLLGEESSSSLSERHTAIIAKYSELFGVMPDPTVNSQECCKDLNKLVTCLLKVLRRRETQILELNDKDHQRVERQSNLYWKCLQMVDPIPANIPSDFVTRSDEVSEPEIAVSSTGEIIQLRNREVGS